jgi:enolase
MTAIATIRAREILDSRGNPTLEVDVELADGTLGRAAVPSGASTGSREARERRDGEAQRYQGRGVAGVAAAVARELGPALRGFDALDARGLDQRLIELDGTDDKSHYGANALLGISLAAARAVAAAQGLPLYRSLLPGARPLLPVPMFNVLNGGAHADNNVDFQEFMIAPVGAPDFREALRYAAETYHALKAILKVGGQATAVGDEGGFAPDLKDDVEALELILQAIEHAGLRPGVDLVLALDPAASALRRDGAYVFHKSRRGRRDAEQMIRLYQDWVRQYPIWSIEDGLGEDDTAGWQALTATLGGQVQLVGDDNFCTNPTIIAQAVRAQIANAALIKPNQIGTLSETLEAISAARRGGYGIVISHRSGETVDDFIADFAVATAAGQIKSGAPARGERVAKYNRLLRIEEELGVQAHYAGREHRARGGFPGRR